MTMFRRGASAVPDITAEAEERLILFLIADHQPWLAALVAACCGDTAGVAIALDATPAGTLLHRRFQRSRRWPSRWSPPPRFGFTSGQADAPAMRPSFTGLRRAPRG